MTEDTAPHQALRIVFFCHSVTSDWNNGHAHFIRGVASALGTAGHHVQIYEPSDAWSLQNLIAEAGGGAVRNFARVFPHLRVTRYAEANLERMLDGADLVVAHEWNPPELIAELGRLRQRWGTFRLLFHDAHHRAVTAPDEMSQFDLSGYDGVLAFGEVLRTIYLEKGWCERAWTWHEAADTRIFRPSPSGPQKWDLVWVGNWGDGEREYELLEYLVEPVRVLSLKARVHGVRYSPKALRAMEGAGISYGGWIANHEVPLLFGAASFTVHVPRRPYAKALPGIPTIRVFEALACGIPLVSAPWEDAEGLFHAGRDYLVARSGSEMTRLLAELAHSEALRADLASQGLRTIMARHTCEHRAQELINIVDELVATKTTSNRQKVPA